MMQKFRNIQPQKAFIIIGIFFGVLFLVVTPPFQVNDENAHFYKSYAVSDGQVLPGVGGQPIFMPESLRSTTSNFTSLIFHSDQKQDIKSLILTLKLPINPNKLIGYSPTLPYPPLPYLASALVMAVAKLFEASPLLLMYLGRLINLLVWVVLVYLAIKITPIHKWVFLLLALMPMTLFLAASLSADSFTLGLSFLTIAFFFKMAFDPLKTVLNRKDMLVLLILIIMLTLSKQVYVWLLLLFFLIPSIKFENRKKRIYFLFILTLPAVLIPSLWNYFFKITNLISPLSSVSGQTAYILSNPLNFLQILLATTVYNQFYLPSFVGIFGWNLTPLPNVLVYTYLAVLVIVAFNNTSSVKVNPKQKLIALTIVILTFSLASVYEYLTFTAVGFNQIIGVQGRYFIPVAPLLFLLFYQNKLKLEFFYRKINLKFCNYSQLLIIVFIIVTLSISIFIQLNRYYI